MFDLRDVALRIQAHNLAMNRIALEVALTAAKNHCKQDGIGSRFQAQSRMPSSKRLGFYRCRLLGFALVAAFALGQSSRPAILCRSSSSVSASEPTGSRRATTRSSRTFRRSPPAVTASGSRNLGPTTGGNPLVMLEISSAGTIRISSTSKPGAEAYFQGAAGEPRPLPSSEQIFREGKAVVLITNNIHSTEIGSSQSAIELAYRLATEDLPPVRKILDNDFSAGAIYKPRRTDHGDRLVQQVSRHASGRHRSAILHHTYAGHDNNRDMFLFSQKETQMMAQVLWHDWFPAIWLDQHQQGNAGARMFTMPAADPINPNVHPLIYRLNTIFGQMQAAALEAAGKDGIMHNSTYTSFCARDVF